MEIPAVRAVLKSWLAYRTPVTRFSGTADEICDQILDSLWNGTYYQTGLSNFSYFWIRDFASMVPALIELGKQQEVECTLRFALTAYKKGNGRVTTCISDQGAPFDLPMQAIDSLPWLLYALHKASLALTSDDITYLQKAASIYESTYIDPVTQTLKQGVRYAELRDVVEYEQSAYAMTMLTLYAQLAPQFSISTKVQAETFTQQLLMQHWNGTFLSAEPRQECFSAECALMPFHLTVLTDRDMLRSTIGEIENRQLAKPYPLAYTDTPNCFHYRFWHRFVPGYGGGTLWPWHGAIYLSLLRQSEHSAYTTHYHNYEALLLRYQTLPELLHANGNWYQSAWYRAEQGMIWAALFRALPAPTKDI